MLLAIDVGNTETVVGVLLKEKILKTWRVSTHPVCTPDEFVSKLNSFFMFDNIPFKEVRDVVISSVVPSFTAILRIAFQNHNLHIIDSHWPYSFTIRATPKEQIGADRLVNAEAAVRQYGFPCIIVDSGTATTLCAVSKDNEYLGGAIMPGIKNSIDHLAQKTAKLFTVELIKPEKVIGHDTQTALQSGLILGYASMIEGMIKKFKQEMGTPGAPVIATGGISSLLQGLAQEITHFDSTLTLKGIQYLYESICHR